MSTPERAKPFVAWMDKSANAPGPIPPGGVRNFYLSGQKESGYPIPCVVTPLLEGDPRPGEVWLYDGVPVTIYRPPYLWNGHVEIDVERADGTQIMCSLADLRPKPKLRTFRHTEEWADGTTLTIRVVAESKDEAVRKIGATFGSKFTDSLEEVTP